VLIKLKQNSMAMFNILPLIFILLSLSVIIIVVVRKFSVLASLDVDNILAEKEAKFKREILGNRLKRNVLKFNFYTKKVFKPLGGFAGESFQGLYNKFTELKDKHLQEKMLQNQNSEPDESMLDLLFVEVNDFLKNDNFEKAEKKLIEIIGIDSRNLKAFDELANVYSKTKQFREAEQTYRHLLKLLDDDNSENSEFSGQAEILYQLAFLNKEQEKNEESFRLIREAIGLEPNNPRYLDIAIEISIINKDKKLALEFLDSLARNNPENNKLSSFEEKIKALEAVSDNQD